MKPKPLTPEELKLRRKAWKLAKQVSGADKEEDGCVAVALLIGSIMVGPNQRKVARLLGVPEDRISWMVVNIRKNKIWHRGKIAGHDWMGPDAGVALNMDACVAIGYLNKTSA